jgi:hypothetical protein
MLRDKLTLLMGLSDVNDAVESLHASRHRCYSVRLLLLMSACGRYGARGGGSGKGIWHEQLMPEPGGEILHP